MDLENGSGKPEDNNDRDETVEVVELEDDPDDDAVTDEMGDMDLEQYEGGEEYDEEEEEIEETEVALQDDADAVFSMHLGAVFCCDMDPTDSGMAVTGGEDDKAYIWNTTNGTKVSECTGHKDSVTCVAFSHDGSMVATGDMSGIVKIWKLDNMDEIWSFEGSDLEWLTWHDSATVLLAGTADGDIWMWKIPSGDCKTMQGHGCQTTCGMILPDGKRCCVGYEDGTVKVWDLKQAASLQSFKDVSGHSGGITSLDCHEDNTLAFSGSIDGTAKLLNTNSGKVLATFSAGSVNETIGETNSIEAVALCNSHPFAAVGSLNGALGIWDVTAQKLRHTCQHEAGIVRVKWDPSGSSNIFTAGLDGCVRLWDARSGQIESSWVGHKGEILDMAISRDGGTVVTASGDTSARVFKLQKPDRSKSPIQADRNVNFTIVDSAVKDVLYPEYNVNMDKVRETKAADDSVVIQPPFVNKTPVNQKPMLNNLKKAPKKPIAHLQRTCGMKEQMQYPRTLFQRQNAVKNKETGWEKAFHLENENYVTVTTFRGRKMVHIRKFDHDRHNVRRPTRKGLVLTP